MSSNTQKIAFNTIVQFLGKMVTVAASLVIIAYLTRHLGIAGYGEYATIFAYLGIFGVIMDMGLLVASVREFTAHPERENTLLKNVFGLKLTSGVIILAFAIVVSGFLPYGSVVQSGILFGTLAQLAMSLNQVPVSFLQAKLLMYRATIADVAGRVTLLGLVIWLVNIQAGLVEIVLATAVANFVVFIISAAVMPDRSWLIPSFDIMVWKRILIKAIPLGIVTVLGVIYFKFDVLILAGFFNSGVVGIYQAPYKILEVLLSVPSIFMGLVLPVLTIAWVRSKEDARKILQKSIDFLAVLAFPITLGIIALGAPIMLFVAGKEFVLSGPVLQSLSLLIVLSFLNGAMIYAIIAADQQYKLIKPYFIAVMFNLAANLMFIPIYSYWAAVIITILTEILVLLATWRLVVVDLGIKISWRIIFRALINSLVMFGVITVLPHMSIWLVIIIAVVIYVLASLLTKTVRLDELAKLIPKNTI